MSSYGVDESLEYYEFEFDSSDNSGTNTSGVSPLDWPLFLLGRPLQNVAAVKIIECQIPFLWYIFTTENNTFVINYGGTQYSVTMTPGTYDSSSFVIMLADVLNAAVPGGAFTADLDVVTQKLSLDSHDGTTYFLFFPFDTTGKSAAIWLGFNNGQSSNSTAGVLITPNSAQITGPNYLYLNSESIGALCQLYLPANSNSLPSGGLGPQMAKIPVNVGYGGIINWQDPDPQKWFDFQDLIQFAQCDFFFTMGNTTAQKPLRFNGQAFSLKLGVIVNTKARNSTLAGTAQQGRVIKRQRVG